jgi:hypothetical protein
MSVFSGMYFYGFVSLARRFCFLAWHSTIPHHMLSSHAGRYYARICHANSSDIFPSWKYGVGFVFIGIIKIRLLFFELRFLGSFHAY